MGELFYDALLEGKVKPFDRVLEYSASSNLRVEFDSTEIPILALDMSVPDKILIKYQINTGSSEGNKYWANVNETFQDYYLFSVLKDENEMILS